MAKAPSLLSRVLVEHGNLCCWCGWKLAKAGTYKKMTFINKRLHRVATVDHILPQSHGGTDHIHNLRPACLDCNNSRGNGWKHQEADVFPSCPLLRQLEVRRPSLKIKLTFPESQKWLSKWKDRVVFRITPHKTQQMNQSDWQNR
jgi:hypothetical protein